MSMHIGRYLPSLTAGCCSNKIYALIFNQSHEALEKVSVSPDVWQLSSYSASSHQDFCIVLAEHPQRSKYYYAEIQSADLTLAATPDGEFYSIEVWERIIADNVYSRAEDTMHEAYDVIWDGSSFIDTRISQSQIDLLSNWVAHTAVTYFPDNQEIRIAAWLEKNGILHTGSQQVALKIYNRSGTKIFDETVVSQAVTGFFIWDSPGLDLDPDDLYVLSATIRSADSVDYETGQAIVTWN